MSSLPELPDEFIGDVLKDVSNDLTNFGEPYENMENFSYGDTKDFLHDGMPPISDLSRPSTVAPDVSGESNNSYPSFNNNHPQFIQPSMGMIPSNEEFPGPYNFDIILLNTSTKYNWVYSKHLNKVFINMGHPLPVEFRWMPALPDLYIRATPLFSLPQHSQDHVVRCLNHSSRTDNSNKDVPEHVFPHVIRCNLPSTSYCRDVDGRYSIITPLGQPQPGTDSVRLMYKFMCKNSCTSGMNRRPLEIVYTLESSSGEILGRRKHEVRICSCPKRDKDKEEDEVKGVTKKRKLPQPHLSSYGKKLSAKEDVDLTTFTLPSMKIVGKEAAKSVIKFAHDLMAGNALRQNAFEIYKPYLDELDKKLRNFEQGRN
ncbi:cellular tumor antigen p53 isoform X2 [Chrysoperla carnea]|nr:cellular tumor antigen p53 isoform X2 [Chrysoperla carnea]